MISVFFTRPWLLLWAFAACSPLSPMPDAGVTVTTIAGVNGAPGGYLNGSGAVALFDGPEGIALDASGEVLFIADTGNHVIRRLDLGTMQVSTIAGVAGEAGANDSLPDGGPAHLHSPRSLMVDPTTNELYLTDTANKVIRKLDLTTNRVTTAFGTAGEAGLVDAVGTAARFSGSGPFAIWSGGMTLDLTDPSKKTMYVADSANQAIRKIDLTSGLVTTIAGQRGVAGFVDGPGPMANFNKPTGLAVDGQGHLFITEANNLTIRRLDLATSEVTTVAGKAPAQSYWYCEFVSQKIPPECDWVDAPAGLDSRFRFPFDVALDGRGGFFLADSHNNVIRRFDMRTSAVTTVAGVQRTILDDEPHHSTESTAADPGTFWHPTHLAFKPPNILFVADRGANCIRRVELP